MEEGATATPNASGIDDPISLIDDNIVRRLVRVAVHIRGYAPYYGATVAFGLMLLFVPAFGRGGDGPAGFAGAAGGTTGVSTQAPPASSVPYAGTDLEYAAGADAFFDDTFATEADYDYGGAYSFDDIDYGSDSDSSSGSSGGSSESVEKDRPCTIAAAPGAPQVSPDREVNNAQSTLEAAAGREAPAEAAPTVKTAAEATGQCADSSASSAGAPAAAVTPVAPAADTDAVFRLVGDMLVI